jgi:hypothetical protein
VELPVPLIEIVCGLPGPLSVTETVPLRLPGMLGVKVTLIMQFAPAARVGPQVLVSPKLVLAAILAMLSDAVPELVSVTGDGWLAVPTTSTPKVRLFADKVAVGDPPIEPPPQLLTRNKPQSASKEYFFIVPDLRLRGAKASRLYSSFFVRQKPVYIPRKMSPAVRSESMRRMRNNCQCE